MTDIWSYTREGFSPEDIVANGNRFLIGNGKMGYRGTMDEWGKEELAAVNLAGIYDQNGDKWREPVNAPNGLFACLTVDGQEMILGKAEHLSHKQSIDFRRGVHSRDTVFPKVRIKSTRFASMTDFNLLCSRLTLTFSENCKAELLTGIVTDIWDINGPHLFGYEYRAESTLSAAAATGELKIPVTVSQAACCDFDNHEKREINGKGVYRRLSFDAEKDVTYVIEIFADVIIGAEFFGSAESAAARGYDALLKDHARTWENIWRDCAVELEGYGEAARALNASLYHLNSIAPCHPAMSIPARGLSGQTYKGAVFWDSEIFLFPVFLHTRPEIAKSLLRYRIETLPGALKKAAEYGYRGAFYPWESQEGGAEGCTNYNVVDVFTHRPVRTYFRDKQIHISGDIAYAFWRYYEITGSLDMFLEGGAEVILQCARFYLSRAHRRFDVNKAELLDVIGPDEYHERVNNNAFTNQMAAHCVSRALELRSLLSREAPEFWEELVKKLDYSADFPLLEEFEPLIRPKITDGEIIEQFDGYFALEDCSLETVRGRLLDPREYWGTNQGVAAHTQIIKQADVIAMMALFPSLFTAETARRNFEYYEPRTEHGSSLSACMYALAACRIGRPDLAWEHFIKSASIDLEGGGKHWAGEIYIGGTHPAANGGAWIIAVMGFAGLRFVDGKLELNPCLPKQIKSLKFPVIVDGERIVLSC